MHSHGIVNQERTLARQPGSKTAQYSFHAAATYPKAEPKLKLESVTNTLVVAVAGSIDEAKFTEPPLQYDGEAFAQFVPIAAQPLKIDDRRVSCTLP